MRSFFQYSTVAVFSPSSQSSAKDWLEGRKSSAITFEVSKTYWYAGSLVKGAGGAMMLRLMSPQPPSVEEPALAMAAMTVLRLCFFTPWICCPTALLHYWDCRTREGMSNTPGMPGEW